MTAPQRIVSLLPSATELLFAIGAQAQVVAVTHECDHPAGARGLPVVTRNLIDHGDRDSAAIDRHINAARHQGSSIYALDEARLDQLRPDLIVTQELCDVCAVAYRDVARAVRQLPGPTAVLSLEPASLSDIVDTTTTLGLATGHTQGAARLAAQLRERIAAVEALPAPAPRPTTVCIEWTEPIMVGGHWVPEMVERAGGVDPMGLPGQPSRYVEWDAVMAAQPDVMVLMPCGFGLDRTLEFSSEIISRPGFAELPCARAGRVVAVDGSSYFNRPGPRIADGLEILAAVLRARPGSALPPGAQWAQPAQRAALA
ncbi:MAG: cobalamin-binding protein [Candidatus Dormibacteria bacterium]